MQLIESKMQLIESKMQLIESKDFLISVISIASKSWYEKPKPMRIDPDRKQWWGFA